jgi:hypothetical protein
MHDYGSRSAPTCNSIVGALSEYAPVLYPPISLPSLVLLHTPPSPHYPLLYLIPLLPPLSPFSLIGLPAHRFRGISGRDFQSELSNP